jgi:putative acetyltransferase
MPEIRPETPADGAAIAQVVERAFDSPIEARLVEAIRVSDNFVAEWSLVAVEEQHIVGHVMVSDVVLRDGETRHRVPALAPLAVDPPWQRRGIGAALVGAVAARVDASGAPLIVLEGSPLYYSRLGFEFAVPLGITIDLPDWAPREAAQVLRLQSYDRGVRGHVEYPPAFDDVV